MTRPARRTIEEGIAAWDPDVDFDFALLFDAPLPLFQEALVGSLPAASSYDSCIAIVGTGASARIYISDGATWGLYDSQSALVADSTATDATQMASDFNDLLAALQAGGVMEASP